MLIQEELALQRLFNSNSHGNGHTDHGVVTCAQEASEAGLPVGKTPENKQFLQHTDRLSLDQFNKHFLKSRSYSDDWYSVKAKEKRGKNASLKDRGGGCPNSPQSIAPAHFRPYFRSCKIVVPELFESTYRFVHFWIISSKKVIYYLFFRKITVFDFTKLS